MDKRQLTAALVELAAALALSALLAACGATTPCDDSDPVGPCATSHSQVHSGA